MARIELSFLGSYQVRLDGKPVNAFESDKVRALLAFLSVESSKSHRRERLADLFWPDQPKQNAFRNLSQALYNLRKVLNDKQTADSYIITSRTSIAFDTSSDYQLDVLSFKNLLDDISSHDHHRLFECSPCMERLNRAVLLYGGEFLADFYLGDNQDFYEWILINRERLHRLGIYANNTLTTYYERKGDLQKALMHAWNQTELDPLWENGYRQLISPEHRTIFALHTGGDFTKKLAIVAPILKHKMFYEEKEWRLISTKGIDVRKMSFRSGKSMLIPYFNIDLGNNKNKYLMSITIGPCPNTVLSESATKSLLSSFGDVQSVQVKSSVIPYRTW